MMQAMARRFRQWFRRPQVPVGDVAGEAWSHVGPLPPAPLMGLEEPALIPLDLPAPPPLPLDARPPKSRDELEWESLLAKMLASPGAAAPVTASDPTPVDPDPTPTVPVVVPATPVVQSSDPTLELARPDDPEADDEDWDAVIARARARVEAPTPAVVLAEHRAAVAPARAPIPEAIEDDGAWETLIAAAKARPATTLARPTPTPVRPAATLVRTPPPVRLAAFPRDPRPSRQDEERAWQDLIARAKSRPKPGPAGRKLPGEETGDWSAVIAAAKLRHQLHNHA